MMNDYAWQQLHAQRESEHRARARRRGGDDVPTSGAPSAVARWLRRHASSHPATTGPVLTSPTTTATLRRTPARRTASDAPTAAARAWVRLASGAGRLGPATGSTAEQEREAA